MSFIAGLLNQSITKIRRASRDGWGDETYTDIYTNVPTKFSYSITREALTDVDREVVRAICYIPENYTVNEDDLIIFSNENYLVYKVEKIFDFFGNLEGYKVYLKSH